MKVVQINAVYHFSSTGRTTEDLHLFLKSQKVESYVFCINVNDPSNGIYSMGNSLDHKFHALMSRLSGLRGYFSKFATKKLISQLDAISPDIVVLRNLHTNYIHLPLIMTYLSQKQIKVVWVLHDCWAYTGGCTHYTVRKCFKWKDKCESCVWKGGDGSWFFDTSDRVFQDRKKLFENIRDLSVVGVSDWVTNEAKQSLLAPCAKRILRIYNWIDLNVFYPRDVEDLRRKHGIGKDDFVILGVAQKWFENKGLSLFLRIADKYPNYKIIMIGSLDVTVPNNIIHVDAIDNTDLLAQYYSLADVFLNFSKQETFGKVAAEAISCGTPVIANNNTANPEIVGECGFVISNNNFDECCERIDKVAELGKSSFSTKCRNHSNTFSKESGLISYYRLFEELIANDDKHKS